MKYIKTTDTLTSENYPYGFRLKTTKTDYLEFDRKRGFRHCSYTINPKTGLQNKPKKSVYYQIMVLGRNEIDHVKSTAFEFYDEKSIDRIINFFSDQDNFKLFTAEQIEYIYIRFLAYIKTSIVAQVQYCGSEVKDLKPLYQEAIDILVKGSNEHGVNNYFNQIKFDWEKINSYKVDGYNPFNVTSYGN